MFSALFLSKSNLYSSEVKMGAYNTNSNCYFQHCVYNREVNMVGCSLSDFERLNSENQHRKQQQKHNKFCLFTVLSCFSFFLHPFDGSIIYRRARCSIHSTAFAMQNKFCFPSALQCFLFGRSTFWHHLMYLLNQCFLSSLPPNTIGQYTDVTCKCLTKAIPNCSVKMPVTLNTG